MISALTKHPAVQHMVVLYGDSIFISSIAAQMQQQPDLHVLHIIRPLAPADMQQVRLPDVFICDLDTVQASLVLHLLKHQPQLILIGVNPAHNTASVLVNQRSQVETMHDLISLMTHSLARHTLCLLPTG